MMSVMMSGPSIRSTPVRMIKQTITHNKVSMTDWVIVRGLRIVFGLKAKTLRTIKYFFQCLSIFALGCL